MSKVLSQLNLRPLMSFGQAPLDVVIKHSTGVDGLFMQCPVCGSTRVWLDPDTAVLLARDKETLLVPLTDNPSYVDETYEEKSALVSVATSFICENEHEFTITFMSGRPTTKDQFPATMRVSPEQALFYEMFPDCRDDNGEVPL